MRLIVFPSGKARSFHDATALHVLILLLGAGCVAPMDERVGEGAEEHRAPCAPPKPPAPQIDIARSLAVTDLPTLEAKNGQGKVRFSLQRVLDRIAASSGANLDAAGLYQRLFDTNNTKAMGYVADGQHCDDQKDGNGNAVLNGFPLECPRQEGQLANLQKHNPFCSGPSCDPYTPVAITNRFDLAASNGQNCGQYRIVFAKGVGQEPLVTAGNPLLLNRVLLIFEAIVPNPKPQHGIRGCAKVVDFWADLSKENDPEKRSKALEKFFFTGVQNIEPALDWSHFSGAVDPVTRVQMGGQIRANQFMSDPATGGGNQMWQLREYNLARACTGHGRHRSCKLKVKMVTNKVNPAANLFDESDQSPAAIAFRSPNRSDGFLGQVAKLAVSDLNRIDLSGLSPEFDTGQSTSSPAFLPGVPSADDTNYTLKFNPAGPFAAAIQARLDAMQSPLTPSEIVRRAQTQSCAGCHELSTSTAPFFGGSPIANQLGGGLVWPDAALGPAVEVPGVPEPVRLAAFTQISDALLVPIESGVTCDTTCTAHPETCKCAWAVSTAMSDVFLPFRRTHMIEFLTSQNGNRGHGHDD